MKLRLVRESFTEESTEGTLYINGEKYCYTLEDMVRTGPKVPGKTAIPYGTYKVILGAFRGDIKRMYPVLLNVPGFSGVCIHGGNTAEDTLGCILVGRNPAGINSIGDCRAALDPLCNKIAAALKRPEEITIEVTK